MLNLNQLRQIWSTPAINHSVLILLSLLGVTVPCWYFNLQHLAIPLILGVIAAALAESDDNFARRVKAQVLTLICFAFASFSIELLFDYPLLFAAGLFSSTIGFIMIGAIGPRYARIAFGSLLIAVYTMLGAHESTDIWTQPAFLLAGAAWYFFISVLWYSVAPMQPVQQSLADVFVCISEYLDTKRTLFHPTESLAPQPFRIKEAKLNARTVAALNTCKQTFLSRSKKGLVDGPSDRFLKIYFLAQDIHERVSSTHYRYQDLAKAFQRSDVMFRFKHLLEMQTVASRNVAGSIRSGVEYQHSEECNRALEELQHSIEYLKSKNESSWEPLISQLDYLFNNLATVEKLLSNVSNPDPITSESEELLDDTEAHSLKDMWARIRSNLTSSSLLFRHAVRLSIALTTGYVIIQLADIDLGYWILLTTLFVCQPNYSATRQKMTSRIVGTMAGLLVGTVLLTLFTSQSSQLVFIILSGVAFFAFRVNNYSYATTFITILVLFCFNQLGDGYAVILPRLADTMIGCALAAVAVTYILPDWQSRRLHRVMSDSISANKDYLAQVIGQYRIGKKNDLAYRIARRHAHNHSSLLSAAITNMMVEPGKYQSSVDESFRFLTLNHALLSYISALGAHRQRIDDQNTHLLISEAHREIHNLLDELSARLKEDRVSGPDDRNSTSVEERLADWRQGGNDSVRMVLQQLFLIYRMLPELNQLSDKLASRS